MISNRANFFLLLGVCHAQVDQSRSFAIVTLNLAT